MKVEFNLAPRMEQHDAWVNIKVGGERCYYYKNGNILGFYDLMSEEQKKVITFDEIRWVAERVKSIEVKSIDVLIFFLENRALSIRDNRPESDHLTHIKDTYKANLREQPKPEPEKQHQPINNEKWLSLYADELDLSVIREGMTRIATDHDGNVWSYECTPYKGNESWYSVETSSDLRRIWSLNQKCADWKDSLVTIEALKDHIEKNKEKESDKSLNAPTQPIAHHYVCPFSFKYINDVLGKAHNIERIMASHAETLFSYSKDQRPKPKNKQIQIIHDNHPGLSKITKF